MMLSDRDIRAALTDGSLTLDPFDDRLIQPASIDICLGDRFRVFNAHKHTHIDPAQPQDNLTSLTQVPHGEPFVLHPGEFALGSTQQTVTIGAGLAARVEGRSSLGRLGLLVHSTAGFIDPGFSGQITLELASVAPLPILLWPGMRVGQLCLLRLSSPAERPYGTPGLGSHYQGQHGPTPSQT